MSRYWKCAVLAGLALSLCGCGGKKAGSADSEPWNRGIFAIMETEQGYYMNYPNHQQLRFHERETGAEAYLCARPECQHQGGEGCVATYRNMRVVNSVLYDGAIYILGIEENDDTASFTLYRASLDGSSLDKVGVVISAKNSTGGSCTWNGITRDGDISCFIIHRGYAYIPYYLRFGDNQQGFAGGGIMKMDIKSGRTEQIYEMKMRNDAYPSNLCAVGNYVYYDLYVPNIVVKVGTYRYDTENGGTACAFGEEWADKKWYALAVTEEKLYRSCMTEDGGIGVEAYDAGSGEALGLQFELDADSLDFDMVPYRDYFFIYTEKKGMIYRADGEKLAEFGYDYPDPWKYYYEYGNPYRRLRFYISQEKLYVNCACIDRWQPYRSMLFEVFSCPIEELLTGTPEWTLVYQNFPWGENVETIDYSQMFSDTGDSEELDEP